MIQKLPRSVAFSLDTSCLVTAWRRTLPMDLFAPVWDHLAQLIDDAAVIATNLVKVELEQKDDELLAWCAERDHMFLEPLQELVRQIERKYPKLVATGRNMADPFVVSLALLKDPRLTVVTEEGAVSGSKNKPNIPFICREEEISSCNLVEMLRTTGFKLA